MVVNMKKQRRDRATRRRLIKALAEKVPHLREITLELGDHDIDPYDEALDDDTPDGRILAARETEIGRVLEHTAFGRITAATEEPELRDAEDIINLTFASRKRVHARESAAGYIQIDKHSLDGRLVDTWQAERPSITVWKQGPGAPIKIEDKPGNESVWTDRGTRRMVDALTRLPDADKIVFEFDAYNKPYAQAAGPQVSMSTKRRVLRKSSPFVQALIDRGYRIKEIEDENFGDWLAEVTMERPAAN
jgi:hypothetical protein